MGTPSLLSGKLTDQPSTGRDRSTDEAWFRQLFGATYRDLAAYARRRVPGEAEANDIVSEVFTTAWRRRDELARCPAPLPWLLGTAGNVIRNQRRASHRRLRLVRRLEAQPVPAAVDDPAEGAGADLRRALARLSFDDQEILRLAAWEGLSHAEIAQALGCSPNAVTIRLHRARRRLRRAVTGGGDTHEDPTAP